MTTLNVCWVCYLLLLQQQKDNMRPSDQTYDLNSQYVENVCIYFVIGII